MTPEEKERLNMLYEWMKATKLERIRDVRHARTGGTALTQVYSVSGGAGGSVTSDKAFLGSEVVFINGRLREIPYIG